MTVTYTCSSFRPSILLHQFVCWSLSLLSFVRIFRMCSHSFESMTWSPVAFILLFCNPQCYNSRHITPINHVEHTDNDHQLSQIQSIDRRGTESRSLPYIMDSGSTTEWRRPKYEEVRIQHAYNVFRHSRPFQSMLCWLLNGLWCKLLVIYALKAWLVHRGSSESAKLNSDKNPARFEHWAKEFLVDCCWHKRLPKQLKAHLICKGRNQFNSASVQSIPIHI